ncbi:N-acetylmuramoyl-L-alanine amidase [Alloactinosynnema sp. L-07]|uniref:glycoside hydrolase domain-containing protein n=1 Tax=Alloactinosynnema sp. L-07 TaxID=1653480 RepID=UPI00065EF3A8|nr:glycoside hydrolase domain-containing protein [Alloactinosynnema sp. L-07]CRK56504.1 N-acetylmuramoyl-L-alanine amidase [Alloactinosynnema sp. L-07]
MQSTAVRAGIVATVIAGMTIALSPQAAAAAAPHPNTFSGKAFDTCETPSSATMQAWSASPYRSIGIYFGGDGRGCRTQANLTAAWVSEQTARGWHLLPLYVGRQAPCSTTQTLRMSADPATARDQGRADATDALTRAAALGIGPGSVLYNDMEHYDSANTGCKTAVLTYLTGWTERVHELDYLSGVYSSAASGIRDLAAVYRSTTYARPDHIDFAWWNGAADTNAGSYVPAQYWSNHQRIHQYRGDFHETYGGVRIYVDANQVDVAPPVNRDFAAYPTLNRGANRTEVAALQYLLKDDGRDAGTVDGDFGSGTEAAVKAFQSAHGLTADGEVGRRTWTALLSAGWQPKLRPGATGQEVRRLQRALTAALGRTVGVDGEYGPNTEQAVREYQTSRGLSADGNAGLQTWTALQSGQ